MQKLTAILVLFLFLISCNGQKKRDLSLLNLDESIDSVLDYSDGLVIGIETVEYPFCLFVEVEDGHNYNLDDIDLKGQTVYFQIASEKLKTDSISRFGGGHIDIQSLKDQKTLAEVLNKYDADNKIYGYRIGMNTPELKKEILDKLRARYGEGTKNPNTDNGLYWNLKDKNRYILYAPDYDRLIVLNSAHLSKTCYWDTYNGMLDLGGCDQEVYMQELVKNSTQPKDVADKPTIKIDKDWNINDLTLGVSSESDFLNSATNKGFERMNTMNTDGNMIEIMYQDPYHDFYIRFSTDPKGEENPQENKVKGYAIENFDKVKITFENDALRVGMEYKDVIRLFDKEDILNYADLKISNYIEINKAPYKVMLIFDRDKFSAIYVQ